ncbi:hypothetical protein WDM22_21625 [Bradyrhizobium septentrionale]|uniref:hypothetical protein n=1 Tax=Bradyrhizobium septentrionale TaxID=1404411 RepID=UPI0030CCA02C
MGRLEINLTWFRDSKGYKIVGSEESRKIVGRGGTLIATQPLRNDALFLAFAKVKTDIDLRQFVKHYGLLEKPSYDESYATAFDVKTLRPIPSRSVIRGEDVEDHLKAARMFHELLALTSGSGRRMASRCLSNWIQERMLDERLGSLGLNFASGAGLKMQLVADSLMNGMLIQLVPRIRAE